VSGGFEIIIDPSIAEARLKRIDRLPSAVASALNKAGRGARTSGLELMFKQSALPRSYIRQKLILGRASPANPEVRIFAEKRGVLLSRYPYKQIYTKSKSGKRKPAGISIKIKPERGAQTGSSWFLIKLRAGIQAGAGPMAIARRLGKSRYPIDVLHGPSISQMWQSLRTEAAPQLIEDARKNVGIAVQSLLSRAGPSGGGET